MSTGYYDCEWSADSRHATYVLQGALVTEPWVADVLQPDSSVRLREPLLAGEEHDYFAVARASMTAIIGVRKPGSVMPDLYRASVIAPGTSVKFANGAFILAGTNLSLNPHGTMLAYRSAEPAAFGPATVNRLRTISTQTSEYFTTISRSDTSSGVQQFEFIR